MEWLIHNPFADMQERSFLFLALYAVVIVLISIRAAVPIDRRAPTLGLEPRLVPSQPGPREIAYLSGGVEDVTWLHLLDLLLRGYLRRVSDGSETGLGSRESRIER